MQDTKLRAECLKAAAKFATSASEVLRLSWAFECYAVLGYNNGYAALYSEAPVPSTAKADEPAKEEPEPPDSIDLHLERMEKRTATKAKPATPPDDKLN